MGLLGFLMYDTNIRAEARIMGAVAFTGILMTIVFNRDFWLPFLGNTAFPTGILPENHTPLNANKTLVVKIKAPEKTRVIYWASKSGENYENPKDAYGTYKNTGTTRVNGGKAVIKVILPATYKVPVKGWLKRHIHYRLETTPGLLGPVETIYF